MKIALAAVGFITKNIFYNIEKIEEVVKIYSNKVDLILFGESFLQGFDCLSWDFSKDMNIAIEQDSDLINGIKAICQKYKVSISLGYIEKNKKKIYSSQITLDSNGNILNNFRRISTGWKEPSADFHYIEGKEFGQFEYLGKTISIGLCGDLWHEENCCAMKKLNSDLVFWPVYTDFNYKEWNEKIKYEYAEQAEKCGNNVLYVNSYCIDGSGDEIARGGAALFANGNIITETPSGEEAVLIVEV
ncbi:MAG: carbon-nitrogen hydrolase family protein [Saccharofermentanales bacterium]|jgi:predicted amidohydrolase